MSSGLLGYSGLVTKTKAMHGRLLDSRAYTSLSENETVAEFISFLRESKGYGPIFAVHEEIAHRGEVEAVIRDSIYVDYRKLYQFADKEQRKGLEIIFFRYEVNILKTCLEYAMQGGGKYDLGYLKYFFDRHACFDTGLIVEAKSKPEILAAVSGTQYEALLWHLFQNEQMTYADYAFQLDVYYYQTAWRMKEKLRDSRMKRIVTQLLGTEIDWQNIMLMYRSKRFYNRKPADIYVNIIPVNYLLSKADEKRMLETETVEEFTQLLADTAYFKGREAIAKVGEEISGERIQEKTYQLLCRKYPMSIAPVLRYLRDKEREIDLLTTVLEGIRYQIPAREIRDLILVM